MNKLRPLVPLLIVGGMLPPASSRAASIIVHADGSGDYPTIQAAIDAATDGDEILLTDGTFRGEGNRDLVTGDDVLTIRSQSGNASACVLDAEGASGDEHRHVVVSGATADLLIGELTLRGGYHEHGGSIRSEGDALTLRACVFHGNVGRLGGALSSYRSTVQVNGCRFDANHALEFGGAVIASDGGLDVVDSEFVDNVGEVFGGAIAISGFAAAHLERTRFERNENTRQEGTVLIGGGAIGGWDSYLDAVDCTFEENVGWWGGAIAAYSTRLTLDGCTLVGNEMLDHVVGGVYVEDPGRRERDVLVRDSLLAGQLGEALHTNDVPVTIEGSTFAGNAGGGISARKHTFVAERSVFHENCRDGDGADILFIAWQPELWTPELRCSVVAPGGMHYSGGEFLLEDVLTDDPLFCGPLDCDAAPTTGGDYTLAASSPCLPARSPCGQLIGARDEGCGDATPIVSRTWGQLRETYREP